MMNRSQVQAIICDTVEALSRPMILVKLPVPEPVLEGQPKETQNTTSILSQNLAECARGCPPGVE